MVRDIANPSKDDHYFPVHRHKDWYMGHSWASGIAVPGGKPNFPNPNPNPNPNRNPNPNPNPNPNRCCRLAERDAEACGPAVRGTAGTETAAAP